MISSICKLITICKLRRVQPINKRYRQNFKMSAHRIMLIFFDFLKILIISTWILEGQDPVSAQILLPDSSAIFEPRTSPYKKTVGLIVTETRSGSSFLGELLNMHPEIFYLYEPLILSPKHSTNPSGSFCAEYWIENNDQDAEHNKSPNFELLKKASMKTRRKLAMMQKLHKKIHLEDPDSGLDWDVKLISDYLGKCHVPSPEKYLGLVSVEEASPARQGYLRSCKRTGICFPTRHKFLEEHPFSKIKNGAEVSQFMDTLTDEEKEENNVEKIRNLFYNSLCSKKKVQTAKLVRLCGIEDTFPIFEVLEQQDVNLQIIYLVRDPRAIFNSRWSLKFTKNPQKETDKIRHMPTRHCDRMNGNVNYYKLAIEGAKNHTYEREFIDNHVQFIKYEDLANQPIIWAKKLYSILGLEMDQVIEDKINMITHGTSSSAQEAVRENKEKRKEYLHQIVEQANDKYKEEEQKMEEIFGSNNSNSKRKRRSIQERLKKYRKKRTISAIKNAVKDMKNFDNKYNFDTSAIGVHSMNSSQVAEHWKKNYVWQPVVESQKLCKTSFDYFGYRYYKTEDEFLRSKARV